jgi:hypothetical protein
MRGAARIITDNPRFQEQLGNIVGAGRVQQVYRLILHTLAESERSVQIADNSTIIPPRSNNLNTTNTHARQVGVPNSWIPSYQQPSGNFAPSPTSAQLPYVPQLSQPSFRHPHSDSGFSSRAPEPMSNERSASFFHAAQAANVAPAYESSWSVCLNNSSHMQYAETTASMPGITPYFHRMPPWTQTYSVPGSMEAMGNNTYSTLEHDNNRNGYASSENNLWGNDSVLQDPQDTVDEQQFN